MGKKGSKRKTRWRTLSIGAPPGEEDEEEGLRKDYVKNQEKDANVQCTFDRNGQQSGYKPRRAGGSTSTSGGSTSGYASSGSRSHRDESAGSPSQPKIIFNEDEYTKITTPRQDVLFKKGYLSRKKPWTGNASTSATPSTTESQSASHSTADGSETTEDQQLLDRDSGTGEYPPMVEQPGAQVGYGAFYDHASGYYYEYPVMLVGPAPVPAQVGPSVLATVPCAPVPLRPIEWINPAFVPKLASQPYCLMDYQTSQSTESATIVEEQNGTMTAEASSSVWNESGTGSASCSGSVAEEIEEQPEEAENATMEQHIMKEQLAEEQHPEQQHFDGQHLENGMTTVDPYLDPVMMPEPSMHIPHVMPTVPQPYMYPGHYMFGPPLVNVNGVTIQGGPLVRTMDATGMTMACAKRRKKRKKRKQRRPTLGNTEDEEEGEYSSECDNEVSSSRLPWSECSTSTATTTMAANRPLNPECQEFQLRPALQSQVLSSPAPTTVVATVAEEVMTSTNDSSDTSFCVETEKMYDTSTVKSPRNQEDATEDVVAETPLENAHLTTAGQKSRNKNAEINGQANHLVADTETTMMNEEVTDHKALSTADNTENDAVSNSVNAQRELSESNSNDVKTDFLKNNCVSEENLVNGRTNLGRYTDIKEKSISTNHQNNTTEVNSTTMSVNDEEEENAQRSRHCNNSIVARTTTCVAPSKKYSKKGPKFVREPTPGPELDDATHRQDLENGKLVQQLEVAAKLSDDAIADGKCVANNKLDETSRETMNEEDTSRLRDNEDKIKTTSHYTTEGSNEDSGFESQTRLSEYPITAAVTEWLRQVNSPELFVTSASTSDSETDDDDEEMDAMPPKNLQGNPMPALSANSGVDTESRTASCGEFATANNNNNDIRIAQLETDSTVTLIGRKKRDAKVAKRKKKAKRIDKQNRNVDAGKAQNQLVSCNRMEEFVTAMRSKNTSKNNVGNVCEFTQKDSVAGMRVALNSRINSKGIDVRRTKTLRKINKSPIENIDIKMRRIDDLNDERGEETDEDVTVSVRTFEKGEIIVSEDGRLLPTSSYKPVSFNRANYSATRATTYVDVINENVDRRNSSENDENAMIASSVSIEEPDVLECWEAETIEPVITPRRMLQSPGVLCEGEAAEEDNFEIEKITMEHIEKYYRLARDNAVSAEEESSDVSMSVTWSKSRTVPNNSEKMMEHFCSEEIPIIMPDGNRAVVVEDEKIPIDEAFEVYESYYNGGKSPFLAFNSKMFKQRPLYGQHGEAPIPCRAVCCNIQ